MPTIDAQLHAWLPDADEYPWDPVYCERVPEHFLLQFRKNAVAAEQLIGLMDGNGVDGALLTSTGIYGSDHRYAFDSAERHPGRFGVVGPISPLLPDVPGAVGSVRDHPDGVGVRLIVFAGEPDISSDLYRPVYAAAERAGLPLFLTAWGMLDSVPNVVRAHPGLQIVLDHLGLLPADRSVENRLALVPTLVNLAELDTVALKCVAIPSLSAQAYPFDDLWPHLHRVIEAFGPERVMWGSDFTLHREELTYGQAVDYLRATDELSADEKQLILGGALQRVVGWSPG